MSARETLKKLDIELIDVDEFSCCGYPLRSYNDSSWFYLSARNLALAEKEGLNMLPLCNGCYYSLNEVKHLLDQDEKLKTKVNEALIEESLTYKGINEVHHILEVLHKEIGVEKIKEKIEKVLNGKFAVHYGCHSLRPISIRYIDDPEDPHILDDLTQALGLETPYYPEKLDCCGASLITSNYEAAFKMTGSKVQAIMKRGYKGIVTNCPFCLKMFDLRQDAIGRLIDKEINIPVFYITQLIGIALGIENEKLGLNFNGSPVEKIIEKLEIAG
jgi:heterodisulfide reductase subunit B